MDISAFLEEEHRLHFYGLLGGLADNLLTLGKSAGTFLSCDSCGETFTLRDSTWGCSSCSNEFSLHFSTLSDSGKEKKEGKVKVSGVSKNKLNPHWYFADENWTVAEFVYILSLIPAESYLAIWVRSLGIDIPADSKICNVLSWPRIKFGYKTIQPDLLIEFDSALVIFEFKRTSGGVVPPREIGGQIVFVSEAAAKLRKSWHLVIVPGGALSVRSPLEYSLSTLAALDEVRLNWRLELSKVEEILLMTPKEMAEHIISIGWETLLERTVKTVENMSSFPWTTKRVLDKLKHFEEQRVRLGLM